MTAPILFLQDVTEILTSICHSAVQEATAVPMHMLNIDAVSVQSMLRDTSVSVETVAQHGAAMFQCSHLSELLTGDMNIQDWANIIFACWKKNPTEITFVTSGSTGDATLQVLETALLWQEAQELNNVLLQRRSRIVAAVPCHHVYGFLFTILLPKVAKLPCVRPIPFPSKKFSNGLASGDFVVAFPLFWEGLVKYELPFAKNIHGSTSTAPCAPATMHSLLHAGLERISNIYGSSETGGIGYQNHPDSPLTLFSFWERISDVQDEWMLARIHPENKTKQPIHIPDTVLWTSPQTFSVQGRKDKIVQVGGLNVSLHRTMNCLCEHPDVKDCAVRLMRQDEGNRLKAFVIPHAELFDEVTLRAALYTLCREKLRPAERPKKITFGASFPKTSIGKSKDWK